MAKLKAHGLEMLRTEREYVVKNAIGEDTRHRYTLSYRSDNQILLKRAFWLTGPYSEGWRDSGWKLHQKLKPGFTMADHIIKVRERVAKSDEWKIVS